jgi:hypothetical protein
MLLDPWHSVSRNPDVHGGVKCKSSELMQASMQAEDTLKIRINKKASNNYCSQVAAKLDGPLTGSSKTLKHFGVTDHAK